MRTFCYIIRKILNVQRERARIFVNAICMLFSNTTASVDFLSKRKNKVAKSGPQKNISI